jgi:hypothetical protein
MKNLATLLEMCLFLKSSFQFSDARAIQIQLSGTKWTLPQRNFIDAFLTVAQTALKVKRFYN